MSIHNRPKSCRQFPNAQHPHQIGHPPLSQYYSSHSIEDDDLTSSSHDTGRLSFSQNRASCKSRADDYSIRGNNGQHGAFVSSAGNADFFEESLPTSVSPSIVGESYNNSYSMPNQTESDQQFSQYMPVCFYLFHQSTFPRNYCLRMISNPWFERVSMMAILFNCVTLGMYQPCSDDNCTTPRCHLLQTFDDIIFGFFAVEMLIKMTAMGIIGSKSAYLSDTWNRLDFFIVIAGALEYCLDVGNMNLSAIRTVRVLRPLRAINRIPSMRILVMLLLDTLPMLGNVLLLCFFVFFIFGIIGVQLWAGLLRQRCHLVLPHNVSVPEGSIASYYQNEDGDKDFICSMEKDNGMHRCTNLPKSRYYHLLCTEPASLDSSQNEPNDTSCVNWNNYYTDCRPGPHNPFQDAISFDNVGMAWTAIFLVISLEGWSDIMYYVQDAHSFWSWIYFVLLIVIGSFFMINLCLVVIATQFSETKKREMERMRQERHRERCQSQSTLASFSMSEQLNCYAAIIQYLAHLVRKVRRRMSKWYVNRYRKQKLCQKQPSNSRRRTFGKNSKCCSCCNSTRYRNSQGQLIRKLSNVLPTSETIDKPCDIIHQSNKNINFRESVRINPSEERRSLTCENNLVPITKSDTISLSFNNDCQTSIHLTLSNNNEPYTSDTQQADGDNFKCFNESTQDSNQSFKVTNKRILKSGKNCSIKSKLASAKSNGIKDSATNTSSNKKVSNQFSLSQSNQLQLADHPIIKSCSKNSMFDTKFHESLPNYCNNNNSAISGKGANNRSSGRHCSAPNLYSHYYHHHHVLPERHDIKCNTSKLAYDMITSIKDNNELHNSAIRLSKQSTSLRKESQGTISWDSTSLVHNDSDVICNIEPDSSSNPKIFAGSSLPSQQSFKKLPHYNRNRNPRCSHQHYHHHHHNPQQHHHHHHHRRTSGSSVFSSRSQMSRRASSHTSTISCKRCCPKKQTQFIYHYWFKFREMIQSVVNHNYFQQAIFLAILFNTFSMGIEYHNQPESLSRAVEISNIIFTAIFGCEMLLKLVADGFYGYIKSGFNVFDGSIVILSLLELLEDEHGSGLSVLRTFRLLRILKLVRFMPALRRQLVIMLRTIDNVAVFFALLILFIFIFSILGMNLFGCKFCNRDPDDNSLQCDRKNFDSLLWALVTVFQILTQEDWNVVLFNGMERTSPYAALYFVALMTFGNYVLFNLLVAILVEGFSQEDERKESIANDNDKAEEVKQERLIYFYGPNDNLEREIQILENPGLESGTLPALVKSTTCGSTHMFNTARVPRPPAENNNNNTNNTIPEFRISNCNLQISDVNKELNSSIPLDLLLPPIITHTAATPQGSPPSSALDSVTFYIEGQFEPDCSAGSLRRSSSSSINQIKTSGPSICELRHNKPTLQVYEKEPNERKRPIDRPFLKEQKDSAGSWSRRSSVSLRDGTICAINKFIRGYNKDTSKSFLSVDNKDNVNNVERQSLSDNRISSNIKKQNQFKTDSLTFPLRKELSCNEIKSAKNLNLVTDAQSPSSMRLSETDKQNSCHKQRRQSFFSMPKRSSLSSEKDNPDSSCPIYARKNTVLRRKSVFAAIQPSVSIANSNKDAVREEIVECHPSEYSDQLSVCEPVIDNEDVVALSSTSNLPAAMSTAFLTTGRKNSLVHEIRVLSPRNSLNGVFYSSSVISVRNSTPNESEFLANQTEINLDQEKKPVNNGYVQRIKTVADLEKIRKFCIYFKWTSWMSEREEYSLFVFSPDNKIRQQCLSIADHPYFDYVVLIFISLNCITLAMERPKIPPWSHEREFLSFANYVFTVVFGIEMLVKVTAKGLFYGKEAYFLNGWNIMDGSLVGISLLDIFLSFFAQRSPRIFGILRVFRLLRSLRPLRVINRAPGLKLVVQTLLSSLRPIGNIVLICCTFFIIFGILGVQLFKGAFYYCDGPKSKNVHNKTQCLSDPRNTWINRKYNFDNLGQALMSLFVLSSKDGWVNIMYTGLDAVGVDQQPIENYNEWRLLYFISFLLLVAFFVLNMFVGVVVENFHRCRREQEEEEKALRAMKRAQKMEKRRKKMREPPYFIGYGRFRQFVHRIVTGKYFDLVIALVIGLNVITMSLEHYLMPLELVYALKLFNFIFSSVFVVEAFMKAIALGLRRYLKDKWNQLDVLIVILSIIGIILEEMESTLIPINPTIIRVMRVARIARVLKLLKMANGIRQLLDTVMQALPQVGNLGLLFFLLFFIFAALGTELFGRLECDEEHPCQGLGEHAHFQNFGMAFLTLFRVATGDNWNGIMKDTLRDKCDPSSDCLQNCCISPIIAPLYFVIFVLMAQFVLVNVVVAVLMKHLEESHQQKDEDEDYEIDMEIAKEIEAEKKALIEAIERRKRETDLKVRRPLMKMASLPSNFTFSVLSLKERSKSEADNSFHWTGKAQNIIKNYKSHEQIELENISNPVFSGGNVCPSNKATIGITRDGFMDSTYGMFHYPLKSSITCDSIFESNPNKWDLARKHNEHISGLRCPSVNETTGILKKSHSLRVKNSRTFLIDSFKRSSLYRKSQTDGKNSNGKKNEDEEAFLSNLDEDEDGALEGANLHISKSTETISDFGRRSCRQRANRASIMNGHQSMNGQSSKNNNRTLAKKPSFNHHSELANLPCDVPKSAVTITIENCPCSTSLCGTANFTKHSSSNDPSPPQPTTEVRSEYLTASTPTTTTSPSRINKNCRNHRKLSDFLDEESAPLSPSLFGVYPEFSNDVTTCEEDLNVLDEEDGNEEMSLASAESWPSAEMPESGSSNIVLDMKSIESKKS